MSLKDRSYLFLLFTLILLNIIMLSAAQNFWKITDVQDKSDKRIKIIWCTISREEQQKCLNFAMANERDKIRVGYDYFKLDCLQAFNKDECIGLLDEEKATLTSLDAGEVFVGGRYNSLVPIAQEVLEGGFKQYYAVAVIKRGTLSKVQSLYDLRGRRACFAGVEKFAGWIIPINTLMREGGMDIVDCNNHVKSATKFFGPSCAVNCLTDKYNPIGDNSDKLCQLCIGRIPGGRCTDADPYAGYEGAFRCLLESGEIAFLRHNTISELISGNEFTAISKDSFELFCKDGSRRPIDDYRSCNWGRVPSNAIVTTSATSFDVRKKYQTFLEKAAKLYGKNHPNSTYYDNNNKDRNIYDDYNSNNNNNNNRQPEYDQYGNRINRFKRQNFGNLPNQNNQDGDDRYKNDNNQYGQQNQYQDGQYNQYGQYNDQFNQNRNNQYGQPNDPNNQYGQNNDNFNQNRNNQYGQPNSPNNQYGQSNSPNNQYGQNSDQFNQNRNNQYGLPNDYNNQYGQRNQNDFNRQSSDPFSKDPYTINRERFGINIDPYENGSYYNRARDPIFTYNNTIQPTDFNFNQSNVTFYEVFNLFESSPRYGIHTNLLVQDSTRNIAPINENQQTYSGFLGEAMEIVMGVRDCQVNRMTLCVTSDVEKEKCIKMRTALKAQLLKPEMECYKGHSQIHCMQAIRSGTADVAVLDAGDVYTAGVNFDLVPFISEVYNLNEPEYYVVAVSKESDPVTDLTYLRTKYTCHGGINTAAGWVYPLAFLISNGWIRPYGCNSIRAAAEYFTKSCVPGVKSNEYNTGVPYDNLCDLCHGSSSSYCRRDASEVYYGHTGAFRCLVEGGGQVAFVKHTTVTENTGGKRKEWWARDNLNDDFELLCPDGTRAEINEYEKCNLGRVKANAIVTRGGYHYNETHVNAYINLFLYAQTFYGRKTTDEFSFSMFSSIPPYTDLIFQDATTQLKVIEPDKRYYSAYLGSDFMRAKRIVDCHAGSRSSSASVLLILSAAFVVFKY